MSEKKFTCPKCGKTAFKAREMVKIFVNEVIDTGDQTRTEEFEVTDKYPLIDDELSGSTAKDWTCLGCKYQLNRSEGHTLSQDFPRKTKMVKLV